MEDELVDIGPQPGCLGKTIKEVKIDENTLKFRFEDGTGLNIWDDGQSCCESRYMNCDDDLSQFVGAKFLGGKVQDGPRNGEEYEESKDCQFLIVKTSAGDFTVANYNEHNGYYGGFSIQAKRV